MPDSIRLPARGRIDFEKLRMTEERIRQARHSKNTRLAYASGWHAFEDWCAAACKDALPASPQTVEDFITWCVSEDYRLSTVTIRTCAIHHRHADAGYASPLTPPVRRYLAQARRELKEEPAGKAALTYEQLCRIVNRLPQRARGVRDRAMILLAFASGWRRSEIAALRFSDVAFVSQGLTLWQRSSKTDQTGQRRLFAPVLFHFFRMMEFENAEMVHPVVIAAAQGREVRCLIHARPAVMAQDVVNCPADDTGLAIARESLLALAVELLAAQTPPALADAAAAVSAPGRR